MLDRLIAPKVLLTLHTTGTSFHVLEFLEGGSRRFCLATTDIDSYSSQVYAPSPRWQAILDALLDGNPFLVSFLPFFEPKEGALSPEEVEEFKQWKAQAEHRSASDEPKSAVVAQASHDRGHFTKEFAWIKAQGELSDFHARTLAWFAKGMLEGDCVYLFVDFAEVLPSEAATLFLDLVERELPPFRTKVLYVSSQQLGVRGPERIRWAPSRTRATELALNWWRYALPGELSSEVG